MLVNRYRRKPTRLQQGPIHTSAGSSSPYGESSIISLPSGVVIASVSGLKVILPAIVMAVTISGDATKAWVAGFPSFRAAKLRL
eukprot:scaffold7020_cov430-Prasinococcus_capsulatus_cf.AAC.3